MDDRTLLEKAAKAAGYNEVAWFKDALLVPHATLNKRVSWNPLTSDADALRLAVKLHLWEAVRLAHRLVGLPECPDFYAATRRSIVRAAAALDGE